MILAGLYPPWYTVVFWPTVWSLITLAYELNRSGTCHGSLGRSNRVTFCPKKESLSKKKFSTVWCMPIMKLIPSPNPHLLPCLDGHATTPHYTSAQEAMNPSMDLLTMLVSKHWKTSQATHQPLCIVIHQSSFLNFVIQAMRSLLKHLCSIAVKWRIWETSLRWKCVQMGSRCWIIGI